jgi:diguanylate cyclase (GGDEF)-like protein
MAWNCLDVLLVEDNLGDARLIHEMLAERQNSEVCRLFHVTTLKAALEKCSEVHFNAILLDLNLPDTSGLDTIKQFHEAFPQIPIVVLTGLSDNVVSFLSMQHGALNYVVKDECTASLLVRTIQYAIERKRVEEHFKHLATHDSLTGLPNRSLFYDRLSQAIHHTERNRIGRVTKWKLAVMLIDLDHFKTINDTLGHAQGDAMIQLATQRLKAVLRESDTIARLGGDEFVALVEGILSQEDCLVVGKKMLHSLSEPVRLEGKHIALRASIGASIFPDDARDVESLIRYADTAMYNAKEQRNQICFIRILVTDEQVYSCASHRR